MLLKMRLNQSKFLSIEAATLYADGRNCKRAGRLGTSRKGFDTLKLNRIIGHAMKENAASIKVLEKIGLVYEADCIFENKEAVIYKIEK